jgi:predicted transposase YbfD/YdcC
LPNGIPTHDTIARVFSRLNQEQFQKCFLSWIQSISCFNPGDVIAIDGKTLRHSYDRGGDKKAIHMVSAWATSQRLVLGQVKVDKKSNEITAIPD